MADYDPELGRSIQKAMIHRGVETPSYQHHLVPNPNDKITLIAKSFESIMDTLGLDRTDDSLSDTPMRVAKMYVNEICGGLDYNKFPKCTTVANKFGYDEMLVEKNITCLSVCEHHWSTIDMKVHIAYVPDKKVLGLSKFNRIAKFFAQRPQVQERYTEQVFWALYEILNTPNIAVVVDGRHYCVIQRGVEDHGSSTITSKLGGGFKDPALRAEFMSLIKG